jgi:TolB-like protein
MAQIDYEIAEPYGAERSIFEFSNFEIDCGSWELRQSGERIRNRHRAVERDEIYDEIWQGRFVSESALSTAIKDARKALGDDGKKQQFIRTIRGRGFRFVKDVSEHSEEEHLKGVPARNDTALHLQRLLAQLKPLSFAVLPFENMSADHRYDGFGDGLADTLITDMSADKRFQIAARTASFAYRGWAGSPGKIAAMLGVEYLVEGSLQIFDDTLRVNIQTIDGHSNEHVFAVRYDYTTDDLMRSQDMICDRFVSEFSQYIFQNNLVSPEPPISLKPTTSNLFRRAVANFWHRNITDALYSIEQIDTVCEQEPEFLYGWSTNALFRAIVACVRVLEDRELTLKEAERALNRAKSLSPQDPTVDGAEAWLSLAGNQFDKALSLADRATRKAPLYVPFKSTKLIMALKTGEVDTAVSLGFELLRSVRYVSRPTLVWFSVAYILCEKHQEAAMVLDALTDKFETNNSIETLRAAVHLELGDEETSRRIMMRVYETDPGFCLQAMPSATHFKLPLHAKLMRDLILATGLPETAPQKR